MGPSLKSWAAADKENAGSRPGKRRKPADVEAPSRGGRCQYTPHSRMWKPRPQPCINDKTGLSLEEQWDRQYRVLAGVLLTLKRILLHKMACGGMRCESFKEGRKDPDYEGAAVFIPSDRGKMRADKGRRPSLLQSTSHKEDHKRTLQYFYYNLNYAIFYENDSDTWKTQQTQADL